MPSERWSPSATVSCLRSSSPPLLTLPLPPLQGAAGVGPQVVVLAEGLDHSVPPPACGHTLSLLVSPAVYSLRHVLPPLVTGLLEGVLGESAGGGREGEIRGQPGRGWGRLGWKIVGRWGYPFGPTSGKWEASGGRLMWASALQHAWYRVKAQKIKVANIIIFLLECSDYKNKTCFL